MKIENIIASKMNTFGEIDLIKEKLYKLPSDYEPFSERGDIEIGCMDFLGKIHLSPIAYGAENPYDGCINIPQESLSIKIHLIRDGVEFTYKDTNYVIHKTNLKHNNP
jgi:hypothetical protein